MASPPAPLIIRPESPADHVAISRVVAAAFGSQTEADLVDRIRASPEYVPELALVAERDGEIVGHVMISHAVIRNDDGDRRISMLSPLAVDPAHQRGGIGRALVEHGVGHRRLARRADRDPGGEPGVLRTVSASSTRSATASRSTCRRGPRPKRRRSSCSRRSTRTIRRCAGRSSIRPPSTAWSDRGCRPPPRFWQGQRRGGASIGPISHIADVAEVSWV